MIFTEVFFFLLKDNVSASVDPRVRLFILLKAIRVNACRALWFPWITKDPTRVKVNLIRSAKAL